MKKLVLVLVLILSGCSHQIMTAQPLAPTSPQEVKVFFANKNFPKCDYQEISLIITKDFGTPDKAVEEARKMAAKVGADFIRIKSLKRKNGLFIDSAVVRAVAYTCSPVDREVFNTKL